MATYAQLRAAARLSAQRRHDRFLAKHRGHTIYRDVRGWMHCSECATAATMKRRMTKPQSDLERALIGSLFESRAKRLPAGAHVLPVELLKCPRCDAPMIEHLPGPRWRRHFECRECWLAFSF